ncbi:MAG: Co2+/Mg2+ efflux protein ApaG [Flavobacteriales bacterium]|nr:Co2+/Mg2+ efflux protein ApaG [Flavobacteriales bacterium]
MSTAVSHDIRVSVMARFEAGQSAPTEGRFLFSYRITIANRGQRTAQLLRRHWFISDSLASPCEVEGPGVVGAVPVLEPGEQFTYTSYCELHSGMGRMHGSYRMRHMDDGSEFDVAIPAFDLRLPYAAN